MERNSRILGLSRITGAGSNDGGPSWQEPQLQNPEFGDHQSHPLKLAAKQARSKEVLAMAHKLWRVRTEVGELL